MMPAGSRSRLLWLLAAAGLAAVGCGREAPEAARQRPTLTLYVPCPLGGPMHKVVSAYEATHRGSALSIVVAKPQSVVAKAEGEQTEAAVLLTMGEIEMQSLVRTGAVAKEEVRVFATSKYPPAVVAAAEGPPGLVELSDLADPEVRRIYIEDPARSTLGARAERALEDLGLWEAVAPKVVRPDPDRMVLGELLAGKAEAAVVFRDCLLEGAGEGASPPKTIRVIGELAGEDASPIAFQAAILAVGPPPESAREFVDFLLSAEGRRAIQEAGLGLPNGQ
jgi:molybdate transport system substrate-binding protein